MIKRLLNRAIDQHTYTNYKINFWSLREALENDLNSFGGKLTKENFLKRRCMLKNYDALAKTKW